MHQEDQQNADCQISETMKMARLLEGLPPEHNESIEVELRSKTKKNREREGIEPKDRRLGADVITQLEYYLSDANLDNDSFLRCLVLRGKGWISLSQLLPLYRIKSILGQSFSNRKDRLKFVAEAIRLFSKTLRCKEWDNCHFKVKRRRRYKVEQEKTYETLYIDNFDVAPSDFQKCMKQQFKAVRLTIGQGWALVDVPLGNQLLSLNANMTSLSTSPLKILTKCQYEQARKEYHRLKKQLGLLLKSHEGRMECE